jgi:hypothetical protein
LLVGRVVGIESGTGDYRGVGTRAALVGACIIGVRRLPRRVWWKSRGLLRRAFIR